MFLNGKVEFPPVKIKLHWPDRWCSYCLQETEEVPPKSEVYMCKSCRRLSYGRTEYVEGTVIPVQQDA